jgi:hypothetical protein
MKSGKQCDNSLKQLSNMWKYKESAAALAVVCVIASIILWSFGGRDTDIAALACIVAALSLAAFSTAVGEKRKNSRK